MSAVEGCQVCDNLLHRKHAKCILVDQLIWMEQKENERNIYIFKKNIAAENYRTDLLVEMPHVIKCNLPL